MVAKQDAHPRMLNKIAGLIRAEERVPAATGVLEAISALCDAVYAMTEPAAPVAHELPKDPVGWKRIVRAED